MVGGGSVEADDEEAEGSKDTLGRLLLLPSDSDTGASFCGVGCSS
jgi:hypothetical protein